MLSQEDIKWYQQKRCDWERTKEINSIASLEYEKRLRAPPEKEKKGNWKWIEVKRKPFGKV